MGRSLITKSSIDKGGFKMVISILQIVNPWSPGGSFMVQKMIITFSFPVF